MNFPRFIAFVPVLAILAGGTVPGLLRAQTQDDFTLLEPTDVRSAVYDPSRERFHIIAGPEGVPFANALLAINPRTGALEEIAALPDPTLLTISDDHQYLYIAVDDGSRIVRFDLEKEIFDWDVAVDSESGNLWAKGLAARPGDPTTIGVSRFRSNNSEDMAVVRDNLLLPERVPVSRAAPRLLWSEDGQALYSGGDTFYRTKLDSDGLQMTHSVGNSFLPGELYQGPEWVFSTGGRIVDPERLEEIGRIPQHAAAAWCPAIERIFIGRTGAYGPVVVLWDPELMREEATMAIPGHPASNRIASLTRWDSQGLGVLFEHGRFLLVESEFVSGDGPRAEIRVHLDRPNEVVVGEEFQYTITVRNLGPDPADDVEISHDRSGLKTLGVEASTSEYSADFDESILYLSTPLLEAGEEWQVVLKGEPGTVGTYSLETTVAAKQRNPYEPGARSVPGQRATVRRGSHEMTSLEIAANDLLYLPAQGGLLATISERDALYPNHLITVDVNTGEVLNALFVGSDPGKMAVSADGRYLYIGSGTVGRIRRLDFQTGQIDQDFALGVDPLRGAFRTRDLLVALDDSDEIIVSRITGDLVANRGSAIFRDGEMLPDTTLDLLVGGNLAYTNDPGTYVAGRNSGGAVRFVHRTETGLSVGETLYEHGTGGSLVHENGWLFAGHGIVFDPEEGTQVGRYLEITGNFALPELTTNRAFFLQQVFRQPHLFSFRRDTFEPLAKLELPMGWHEQEATSFVRIPDGFAIARGNRTDILRTSLPSATPVDLQLDTPTSHSVLRRGMNWRQE